MPSVRFIGHREWQNQIIGKKKRRGKGWFEDESRSGAGILKRLSDGICDLADKKVTERRKTMLHWDMLFMLIGVAYTCYVTLGLLVKLDYQARRRKRRG